MARMVEPTSTRKRNLLVDSLEEKRLLAVSIVDIANNLGRSPVMRARFQMECIFELVQVHIRK